MNIQFKKLMPQMADEFLHYFENVAFPENDPRSCWYCLESHLPNESDYTAVAERREKAKELILNGIMTGYLIYDNDQVIGWCNVNARENYRFVTEMFREIGYQTGDEAGARVKAIYCFLIAPKYRGKGVARKLLERVCEDAAHDGYDCIEAYPFADERFEFQYHGGSKMYEQSGFTEVADLKYVKVMQKKL
ncbi:MAG: GNAT family N-acetyltransferase [Lachnospiraceae bacterium]|nr:GNAT family N-acetyltransferase [Lachnospiraceae bacterium]